MDASHPRYVLGLGPYVGPHKLFGITWEFVMINKNFKDSTEKIHQLTGTMQKPHDSVAALLCGSRIEVEGLVGR